MLGFDGGFKCFCLGYHHGHLYCFIAVRPRWLFQLSMASKPRCLLEPTAETTYHKVTQIHTLQLLNPTLQELVQESLLVKSSHMTPSLADQFGDQW